MYPDTIPVISHANYSPAVMRGLFSLSDFCMTSCMLLALEHYVELNVFNCLKFDK